MCLSSPGFAKLWPLRNVAKRSDATREYRFFLRKTLNVMLKAVVLKAVNKDESR